VDASQLSLSHIDFDSFLTGVFAGYQWNRKLSLAGEYAHTFMFERSAVNTTSTNLSTSDFFVPVSTDGSYRASMDRFGVTIKYAF